MQARGSAERVADDSCTTAYAAAACQDAAKEADAARLQLEIAQAAHEVQALRGQLLCPALVG